MLFCVIMLWEILYEINVIIGLRVYFSRKKLYMVLVIYINWFLYIYVIYININIRGNKSYEF